MIQKFQPTCAEFDSEASYEIVVGGRIPDSWVERMGGMQVIHEKADAMGARTVLRGKLKDQAELNGVLESIYRLHLTIFTVQQR